MEEAGTITWMDHISQNVVNMNLNFGHNLQQDCIFGLYNFQILNLLESLDIENVEKLSSFSI